MCDAPEQAASNKDSPVPHPYAEVRRQYISSTAQKFCQASRYDQYRHNTANPHIMPRNTRICSLRIFILSLLVFCFIGRTIYPYEHTQIESKSPTQDGVRVQKRRVTSNSS